MSYEDLVEWARTVPFEGWDWSAVAGRLPSGQPSWDLRDLLAGPLRAASSLLDLGTGGGEFLSSLAPLPDRTAATESYRPNVPVARRRLEPLGVRVVDTSDEDEDHLPFPDHMFDMVVSRHESYLPAELRRVLVPGGTFVTQQVGGLDLAELNAALGAPPHQYQSWNADAAAEELERAGLRVTDRREEMITETLDDIGAVVLFLRLTPWHVPGFDVGRYDRRLRALHADLSAGTPLEVRSHRFLITAEAGPKTLG